MKYIPQSFSPEKEKYWKELNSFLILFIIIAMVPTAFIIAYLFLRFILKKCEGPKKIKQVSKIYRNITWVIMVISSGTTLS